MPTAAAILAGYSLLFTLIYLSYYLDPIIAAHADPTPVELAFLHLFFNLIAATLAGILISHLATQQPRATVRTSASILLYIVFLAIFLAPNDITGLISAANLPLLPACLLLGGRIQSALSSGTPR